MNTQAIPAATEFPTHRWIAMSVLFAASFMSLVDVTIVNVALPQIQSDLGASNTALEWIVAGYVLCFAVGLLPSGRYGDAYGRKRLFLWGVASFALSSLACGLAQTPAHLVAGRIALGATSALMVPQVMAIVHVIFPPEEKATVFGIFGVITRLGAVAGNVVGGLLIDLDIAGLSWRTIFLVNLPICAAVLCLAAYFVPPALAKPEIKPDFGSVLIFGLMALSLILPLVEGRAYGWPLWMFGLLAMVPVLGASFVKRQKRRSDRGNSQLIPSNLLHNGSFISGLAFTLLFFAGLPGMFLTLSLFFQAGFGITPLQSGLATAPFPVFAMVTSLGAARLRNVSMKAKIAAGSAILFVGMVTLRFMMSNLDDTISIWSLAPSPAICGAGLGPSVTSLFPSILCNVAPQDAGAGSGALQTMQQIGAAFGIAVSGHFFFSTLELSSDYVTAARQAILFSIWTLALVAIWQAATIGLGSGKEGIK